MGHSEFINLFKYTDQRMNVTQESAIGCGALLVDCVKRGLEAGIGYLFGQDICIWDLQVCMEESKNSESPFKDCQQKYGANERTPLVFTFMDKCTSKGYALDDCQGILEKCAGK